MANIRQRKLSDFFNTEFRKYAIYTVHERAIPSLLSGLKPVHQKILYTALKRAANKQVKVASLAGHVLADADYKHGDSSCAAAIVNMAAQWRNHICLLEGEGNFGWRLYPEAGAPRYIFVRLSGEFDRWFGDSNVLEPIQGDDGQFYEPSTYYSNIPWFLVNGVEGIATGYSCFCHPRSPANLRKLMLDVLSGEVPDPKLMTIEYPSYSGDIVDGYSIGQFRYRRGKKLEILSLPVDHTIDTFTPKLASLVEKGKIRDFHKTVSQSEPPFVVDMKDKIDDPTELLGLRRKLREETVTLIHGDKLLAFDSPWDAVGAFIDARLKVAERSIEQTKVEKADLRSRIETKIAFVHALQERGLEGLTRNDLRAVISGLKRADMTDTLMAMSATSMTEESIAKWTEEMSILNEEIDILGQVDGTSWLKYSLLKSV